VTVINQFLGRPLAVAVDGGTAEVAFPPDVMKNPVAMLAKIETLEVDRDIGARVVVNEKTGTIIMGDAVTIGRVALAHGNLNITVRSETGVSQPNALAGGTTTEVTNTDIQVGEEKKGLAVVGGGQPTLGELVKALNALGATPRDLISIFQALKKAGALNAELVVM
jgi:flagellar P-ring protein precursor FlgI